MDGSPAPRRGFIALSPAITSPLPLSLALLSGCLRRKSLNYSLPLSFSHSRFLDTSFTGPYPRPLYRYSYAGSYRWLR